LKYIDSKWQSVSVEDAYKLTKIEGQVAEIAVFLCIDAARVKLLTCNTTSVMADGALAQPKFLSV